MVSDRSPTDRVPPQIETRLPGADAAQQNVEADENLAALDFRSLTLIR